MNDFYVYAYIDPRNDEPFYIGKGRNGRIDDHLKLKSRRKKNFMAHKINKMRAEGVEPVRRKLIEGLDEKSAFYFESFFIKAIGRRNLKTGPLTNLSDGGEGASGHIVSAYARERMRAASIISNATNKEKRRAACIAAYTDRPEVKEKMRAAMIAYSARPEVKEKKRAAKHLQPPKGRWKGIYEQCSIWQSCITVSGQKHTLGNYNTPEHAARVYDTVAKVLTNGICYVNLPMIEEWWEGDVVPDQLEAAA